MINVKNILDQESVQDAAIEFGKTIGVAVAKVKQALKTANRMPNSNKAQTVLAKMIQRLLESLKLHQVSYTT